MSAPEDRPVPPPSEDSEAADAVSGLARVAAAAYLRTAAWGLKSSLHAARRLAGAAVSPQEASTLAHDVQEAARGYVQDLAGVADLEERVRNATGVERRGSGGETETEAELETRLQRRGRELMRKSSDVRYVEDAHPAYERILDEIAPDEGRILRLMMLNGPQPAVDVRTGGPMGLINSELLAPGLSMIGPRAGLRYVDRVPSYLNNLFRLGMIWFSRETLRDSHRYQVIEAQPDVLAAMHAVRFPKIVRRSIHLTPFGEDFCRDCLSLEIPAGAPIPQHADPGSSSG